MSEEILYNSPALHALKRHQLVSLSKRYGLKASGKNVELIDRLKEYSSNLSPTRQMHLPLPAATPGPGVLSDFAVDDLPTTTPSSPLKPLPTITQPIDRCRWSRASDNWEVLSESGASLISPAKQSLHYMTKSDSMRSWKSAKNGESSSEFGVDDVPSNSTRSKSSSIRSIASSLSRRASRHLMSRSHPSSMKLDTLAAEEHPETEPQEYIPPSPASTVGIPRRHSTISLLERPSTIRLISPPPPSPSKEKSDVDTLPFFNSPRKQDIKGKRSLAPLRSPQGHTTSLIRKSMPALPHAPSASVPSIYPPLPSAVSLVPPAPPIPGAYRTGNTPPPVKPFAFSASNAQFSDVGKTILAEMEAKMKATLGEGAVTFGQELLKGKQAEMTKLVSVQENLGEGGWGLSTSQSGRADRYATAHHKEFDRMQSISDMREVSKPKARSAAPPGESILKPIVQTPGKRKYSSGSIMPSAPNGLPLAPQAEQAERETKRKKLSAGPSALGSLRDAGRSLVNLLESPVKALTPGPKRRNRRPSVTKQGRNLASRFGLFRNKQRESLSRSRGPSTSASTAVKTTSTAIITLVSSASVEHGQAAKPRQASTSAETMMSTSSKTPQRSRIPEFGTASMSRSTSINNRPKPPVGSTSSTAMLRKASQAETIRNARPAPPPPNRLASSTSSSRLVNAVTAVPTAPTLLKRSSTLYAPTASSLARMQATVRPSTDRPLPVAPSAPTVPATKPSESSISRSNTIAVDVSSGQAGTLVKEPLKPVLKPAMKLQPKSSLGISSLKSPSKTASSSAAKARAKASGLSAVKSRTSLKEDREVAARRAGIRAKQERVHEERELRKLLGGPEEDVVM